MAKIFERKRVDHGSCVELKRITQEEYVETTAEKGHFCPECGYDLVFPVSAPDVSPGKVSIRQECSPCSRTWTDVFELTSFARPHRDGPTQMENYGEWQV